MKMGLLTDPAPDLSLLKLFLIKYQRFLCFGMFISSFIWLGLLAHDEFSAATYFSENALLPGLVQGAYVEDHEAYQFLNEIRNVAEKHPYSIPHEWLSYKFEQLLLETYIHNFSLTMPFRSDRTFTGHNVYGILRAPRTASTESLVLTLPYRSLSSVDPPTIPGLALMLSLAKFFRRQKYWAKDVIFLVVEHEQLGIQAWLDAYHGTTSGTIGIMNCGDLSGRSGAIQAALNLEIHSNIISNIDVKISGLNGQLPNLDFFNLVHRICDKEGVRHTFYNKDPQTMPKARKWKSKFQTLLSMIVTQATGVPDGNHGLFHRFGIQALTIEAHPKKSRGPSYYHMGRVIEAVFRSLNNLLERFHQSFFFYLLPSNDRYVSIGLYFPCAGLLAGILFLKALTTWVNMLSNFQNRNKNQKGEEEKYLNLTSIIVITISAHALGISMFYMGGNFAKLAPWPAEKSLLIYHLVVFALSAFVSPFLVKMFCSPSDNWSLLNVLGLTELASLLLCISMCNFSFGYILSIIYVFPTFLINDSINPIYKKILWLMFHPIAVSYAIVLVTTIYLFPELEFLDLLYKSLSVIQNAIILTISDTLIYGSWTYTIVTSLIFPIWLMFWCLLHAPSVLQVKEKEKTS